MSRSLFIGLSLFALAIVPVSSQAHRIVSIPSTSSGTKVPPHTWPAPNFSPGNNAYNYNEHTLNAQNVSQLHFHALPTSNSSFSGDVIGDGLLFHPNPSVLIAVNLHTGKVRWKASLNIAGIVFSQGTLYAVTGNYGSYTGSSLLALNAQTGTLRWQITLTGTTSAPVFCCQPPTIVGNRLYMGTSIPTMNAFDTASGELVWQQDAPSQHWAYGQYRGHAVLYVSGADSPVLALDAATGTTMLTWQLTDGNAASVDGLLYADNTLYIAGWNGNLDDPNGRVYALDSQATLKWTIPASGSWFVPTAVSQGELFGLSYSGFTCQYCNPERTDIVGPAYSKATGAQVTPAPDSTKICPGEPPICSPPVLANGLLYVGGDSPADDNGTVTVLDPSTLTTITTLGPAPNIVADMEPVVLDGRVYIEGGYFSLPGK